MSDPFRPNDNRQLLREAQMGFVVIGLLLCVLVYVLFYRLVGRGQRFQEMARDIPVALSVGADPYLAHRVAKPLNRFERLKSIGPQGPTDAASATKDNSLTIPTTRRTFDAVKVDTKAHGLKKIEQDFVAVPPVLKSEFGKNVKRTTAASNAFDKDKDTAAAEKTVTIEPPKRVETAGGISAQSHFDGSKSSFVAQASGFSALSPPKQVSKQVEESVSDFVTSDSEKTNLNQSKFEISAGVSKHPSQNSAGDFTPLTKRVDVGDRAAGQPDSTTQKIDSSTFDTYVTVAGDSLWTIAQSAYGDGRYFRALYELNQLKLNQSEPLPAGTVIKLLAPRELKKRFPTMSPRDHGVLPVPRAAERSATVGDIGTTQPKENLAVDLGDRYYRTQDGDTLFGIARQRLGQASRYLEIYDLNQFRIPENVNHLTPLGEGIELLLPE